MSSCSTACYIDIRNAQTTEHISLDLTRHLPRRLTVGPAVIIDERPDILLAVIRKRWMYVIREVEKQLSSTLDRRKKHELTLEITRMRQFSFSSKITSDYTDVLIISPSQTVCDLPEYATLYILSPLTSGQFLATMTFAKPCSTVTVYGQWSDYATTLESMHRGTVLQYGEDTYPMYAK